MIPADQIVRWKSTADPSLSGVEVVGLALRRPRASKASQVGDATFVLAALGSSRPSEVAVAIAEASAVYGNARACMALDAGTLFTMDADFLRDRNIAVVLDRADEMTPLGAMAAERVEAVRFEPSFVARAMTDGRLACVLDAMLGLARDLGIATLGATGATEQRTSQRFEFDYVTTPVP